MAKGQAFVAVGKLLLRFRAIAETGVTYISAGRITQSAPAADIGLDFA